MESEFSSAATSQQGTDSGQSAEVFTALRRFAKSRPNVERCELCGLGLAGEHQHLLDRTSRQIACACDACAILFCAQEGAKFLRVPRRIMKPQSFRFTDVEWEALMLPINLAFFLRQPNGETAVLYPSPAGVMESMIELPPWSELFVGDAALSAIAPEVEALLVNRIGGEGSAFVVPIDAAYRLVGLIRTKWRGLSGGTEVWQAVSNFFVDLDRQATPMREAAHA